MTLLILADGEVMPIPMDSIVHAIKTFHLAYPIVGILMVMMAFDVCIGLCAAVVTKTVSSTISQAGMVKKVIVLLLVALGTILEPYSGGMPLSQMISMSFIVTELISIAENAARAGVPLPDTLKDLLQKLRNNEKASVAVSAATVNINRVSNLDLRTVTDGPTDGQKDIAAAAIVAAAAVKETAESVAASLAKKTDG